MLNNFDPDICPLCNVPTEQRKVRFKACYFKACYKYTRDGHVAFSNVGTNIKDRWEEISIGNYILNFYPNNICIINEDTGSSIEIENSPLLFKDLDSEEKIKEVFQNYELIR